MDELDRNDTVIPSRFPTGVLSPFDPAHADSPGMSDNRSLSAATGRRVATLERQAPRTVQLALDAGVGIEYLGIARLPEATRVYAGDSSDWVVGPAQETDAHHVPREQRAALERLDRAGVHMPLVYVAHEIPKGRHPDSDDAPTGAMVPVTPAEATELVGPVPPPAGALELGERLGVRSRQVFAALGTAAAVAGTVVAAPFVLTGAAVAATAGALARLDPIVFGVVPARSSLPGEPAAFYMLARWDW